jgi:hypothetical protein
MSRSTSPQKTPRTILSPIVRKLKGMLISSTEMVLAVAIVLVFAIAFLGILIVSFPRGTGLVDFYDELVEGRGPDSNLQWRQGRDDTEFQAVLSHVRRRVRDRPADAFAWNDAHTGKRLQDRHTVQTLARSAASISIGTEGELRLGERSLVVVKQESRRRGLGRRRSSVVLLGGRIDGRIGSGKEKTSRLELLTAGGRSEIRTRDRDGVEFSVSTNPDRSSTLNVFSGVARLTTADGKMTVGPNEAITYDPTGLLGAVVPVPDPPEVLSPRDGSVHVFGSIAPRIRFRWAGQEGTDAYRFVLARDRDLSDVVYAGELSHAEFVHGNLESGRYYWSVRSVSGHAESRPSVAQSLRLVRDLDPPELSVNLPEDPVTLEELVIRGTTEPGSELFIKNENVPLATDGGFEYALKLKRGLNMIVVEAVDAAGNSAYHSQYVTARF